MQTAGTASVDWLGCSWPDGTVPEDVCERFGRGEWIEMAQGMNGYRRGWQKGNVRVLYDGLPGMGVHMEASGGGCRQLEAAGVVEDWRGFLGGLLKDGASLSRLDLAVDDRAGLVDLVAVQRAVKERRVVSRYRSWKVESSGSLDAPEEEGTTVYFGSASSDTRIRMYDKAAQLGEPGPWVRVELQTRDDRAQAAAIAVVQRGLGAIAPVLRGLLDFKVRGTHSQRERWASASWWTAFLGTVVKARLVVQKAKRTLAGAYLWVKQQVGPTLAVLVEAGGWGPVAEAAREGQTRWKQRHRELLASAAPA